MEEYAATQLRAEPHKGDPQGLPLMVEAIDITKTFGDFKALDNINLMFKGGEIHCLAGENGSGKSTLVKVISGIYTPDKGTIVVNGRNYSSITPVESMREGIQVIYQDLSLFEHMNVAENIAIGKLRETNQRLVKWPQIYEIAAEQLRRIGIVMKKARYFIDCRELPTRTVNEIGPERLRSLLARRESGLPDDGQLSLPFDENP